MLMAAALVSMMMIGSLFIGGDVPMDDVDDTPDDDSPAPTGDPSEGFFDLLDLQPPSETLSEPASPSHTNIEGTDGTDRLLGDDDANLIRGGDGFDEIAGRDGDDIIFGDGGSDDIHGEAGDDHLYGGDGDDSLAGEDGDDWLDGGAGNDALYGYTGHDHITGGDGADTLAGGQGNDVILAGSGDDQLSGGYGNDTLTGGRGMDVIMGGRGDDVLVGSVEHPDGSDTDGRDYLNGGRGDDQIYVGQDDVASGGEGADTFWLQNWVDGAQSQIMDFDSATDSIVIMHSGDAPTDVDLSLSETDPDKMMISVDGTVIASVAGGAGLALDDITFVNTTDVLGGTR